MAESPASPTPVATPVATPVVNPVADPPTGSNPVIDEASRSPFDRFLSEQAGFALSLAYLIIGLVGSFYYYRLFAEFGINIFEFAEVGDFLLVVFRQPLIPALCLGFGLAVYLLYRLHRYLRRRVRRYEDTMMRWILRHFSGAPYLIVGIGSVPVLLIWIIPFVAHRVAVDIRRGHTRLMEVRLNADSITRLPITKEMRMIGATGKFIIFYSEEDGTVIIPNESIARILLPRDE